MDTGPDSYVEMMSEDTDIELLAVGSQPNGQNSNSRRVETNKKGAGNYTHQEDIQLCMSWENISTDLVVGNEQPGKAYWKRIAAHFHANKTFESNRNDNSLEHRWSTIQKECQKFQGFFEQIKRRHPSGIPYKEHLLEAQALYAAKDPKKKGFQFVHCWLKVRNSQKFLTLETTKSTNKRPRAVDQEAPNESVGDEEDKSGKSKTPDSSQPSQKNIPTGRKQAKEKLKSGGDARTYKEAIQELVLVKEKKVLLKEDRWKETKMMQERKLLFEERKLMWDQEQKIMFCDVNTLEPDVKTYVLAMRAQIAAQKVAALCGASSAGFNNGGASSGGVDGEGSN